MMGAPVLSFDDADNLVKAYFRAHERIEETAGDEPSALNEKGFGGASVGEGQVYFEYLKDKQALECSALVYRFRSAPRPGMIDGFKAEAKQGTATGGGEVDFEPENGSLFLSRVYGDKVDYATFVKEIDALLVASVDWAKDVVPRVAQKINQGK